MGVEHISQDDRALEQEFEWESTVRFVWADRVYQVQTRTFQDNFDLEAVLALLNEALRDQGYPERFIRLATHDAEQYLFGDHKAIVTACDDLQILHRSGPDYRSEWQGRVEGLLRAAGSA